MPQSVVNEAQTVIALAFEGEGEAWWSDHSGDDLARVAAQALASRGMLRSRRRDPK